MTLETSAVINSQSWQTFSPHPIRANQPLPPRPTHRFRLISYEKSEHVWSYVGKIAIITRNLLNAAANNCRNVLNVSKDFPAQVKNITTHMKLLSIVGIPFSLVDLKSNVQKVLKSFLLNDKEGVVLGSLSLSIIAADAFDSLTTFINTALTVASLNPIKAFSTISLPMAFAMSGLGVVSRTVQIAKSVMLYKNIRQYSLNSLNSEKYKNKISLKNFVEEKIGIDAKSKLNELPSVLMELEKIQAQKKAALLRHAPIEVLKELEGLLEMFALEINHDPHPELSHDKSEKILAVLKKIQFHLQKKIKIDALGILANLVIIAALVLLSIGTGGALPFLLLFGGFATRLVALAYKDLAKNTEAK